MQWEKRQGVQTKTNDLSVLSPYVNVNRQKKSLEAIAQSVQES